VEVIGLAFEASSDLSVAKPKIESFIKRVGIDYPILFAGDTQEETIVRVLPMLHKINGYPTTFIIDKKASFGKFIPVFQDRVRALIMPIGPKNLTKQFKPY